MGRAGEEGKAFHCCVRCFACGVQLRLDGATAKEAAHELFCDLAGIEAANSAIEYGGREEGVTDSETVCFREGNCADLIHPRRGKGA